ncbi:PEP/pyruvate-binding domain-containing protein, partial [Actinoalloteichus spitiensis]|uniref:PEP/pyruvate-binding domain-containing protein n=1 Tax=Actinoalloteichus spitiensis TaxID=252394 RepID=UPI000377F5CD
RPLRLTSNSWNSPEVADAVTTAYRELAPDTPPVAVRSSATAEDLPELSFAGQQDTVLNVRGERDLLHALTRCWASLWTPWAVAYRERHDVDPATVAMSVVVQLLVPARAAGVLFTANPLTGSRDELVINASWGLGESVVSGQVSPDTVIVDQRTGRTRHHTTSAKTVRTVPVDGGVREEAIDDHLVHAPVLTEQDITRLTDLARRVDALHDHPSDVEWALDDDGTLHLLQARPITGLPTPPLPTGSPSSATTEDTTTRTRATEGHPPATSSPRPPHQAAGEAAIPRAEWNDSRLGDYLWTNANLGEAIPSVMTPATWSFVQVFMLRTMGIPSCQGHPTWGNIGGRFYLNLSTSLSLGTAFGRTVDQMADTVSAVFGRIPPGTPVPLVPLRRWATLREVVPLVTAFRLRLRIAHRRLPSYLDTAADRCAALRARARTAPTTTALLQLWRGELWPYCVETFDMMSAAARGRGGGNRLV